MTLTKPHLIEGQIIPEGTEIFIEKYERDYKAEYKNYHSKPEQKKNRAYRNKARREMGLEKGDGLEVDHIIPLSKGGGIEEDNLQVLPMVVNRSKGNKTDFEV